MIRRIAGFSLVEVVLAIGIIAFAILAIVGAYPIGLQTSHSSQDETRARVIAQQIFAALSTQARPAVSPASNLMNPVIINDTGTTARQPSPSPTPFSYNFDLTGGNPTYVLGADNDGNLAATYHPGLPYQVTVTITANPTGFTSTYASVVTVRVAWQQQSQNYREFTSVITRY